MSWVISGVGRSSHADFVAVGLDDRPGADVADQTGEFGEGGAIEEHRIAALATITRRDDRRQRLAMAPDQRRKQRGGNAGLIGEEEEDGGNAGKGA